MKAGGTRSGRILESDQGKEDKSERVPAVRRLTGQRRKEARAPVTTSGVWLAGCDHVQHSGRPLSK